jgi:hypothetical protein
MVGIGPQGQSETKVSPLVFMWQTPILSVSREYILVGRNK